MVGTGTCSLGRLSRVGLDGPTVCLGYDSWLSYFGAACQLIIIYSFHHSLIYHQSLDRLFRNLKPFEVTMTSFINTLVSLILYLSPK